ncbi:hypothetical protein B0H10DRAFT_2429495 [Mycena sp. CBHHK59/15]|nr:hypothetical protein B0H10DRAFT_2429495 [Mycena sp. CBHHK59/15]
MLASTSLVLAGLAAIVNAHFQLQFPGPRGPFVEDDEPTFCDGYDSATTNRTVFPLAGGFFTLNSEHTTWTAGVSLSTKEDPTSFQDFSTIIPFFQRSGEGVFCIPLDFSSTNATGLKDGLNVTLEIIFDGGDGELFQCADLTLSSTAKISSTVTCNGTAGDSSASGSGSSASATAPGASASPSTKPSAAQAMRAIHPGFFGVLLGLVGIAAFAV